MKVLYLVLTITLLSLQICLAQIGWQKTYSLLKYPYGFSMDNISSGGYIIGGSSADSITVTSEFALMRVDYDGSWIWSFVFNGGSSMDEGRCVTQSLDDGFVLAGDSYNFGTGLPNATIMKTDSSGNFQWIKAYDFNQNNDWFYAIQCTTDSGYIVAGETWASFGVGGALAIKMNGNGNISWAKKIGSNNYSFSSVQQTSDNGYIFSGYTMNTNPLLVRVNANGVVSWSKSYYNFSTPVAGLQSSVKQTPDGGFILSCYATNFSPYNRDLCLIKTDSMGNIQWSKTYGMLSYNEYAGSMLITQDGGFALAGEFDSLGSNSKVYFLNVDSVGVSKWSRHFGDTGEINPNGIWVSKAFIDGFTIGCSTTNFTSADSNLIYLIRTDTNGISSCYEEINSIIETPITISTTIEANIDTAVILSTGSYTLVQSGVSSIDNLLCLNNDIQDLIHSDQINIYPNPASDEVRVFYSGIQPDKIEVFNLLGARVMKVELKNSNNEQTIYIGDLQSGIYFISLTSENGTAIQKLIKQ